MLAQVIIEGQQCLEPSFTEKFVVPILPYFDILYCLLTLGLLIVAWKGLKQITLGRQIANLNAQRDALKVTAEQCRIYADKIIPLSDALSKKIQDLRFFDAFTFSVKGSVITVENTKELSDDDFQQLETIGPEYVKLFNAIDSFSQHLTSGLADEKNAYFCLGDAHLSIVSRFLPLLVPQAQDGHEWCNTLHLFVIWYERQHVENIEREKTLLFQKVESLDKEKELYKEKGVSVLDVDSFYKCDRKKK